MDPMSISGLVASILPIAYQVAAGIFGFAIEAHGNSETLNAFASEIQSLTRVLEAATSTINDANFPAQPDVGPSTNVYRALHGAMDDIRLYLERLRLRVQRIQGDHTDTNLYRNAVRTFAARINRTGINDLRSLLQTHHLSLNTALVMVHLYHATHTAGHQQMDLRPDIYRLTSIVQRLATAVSLERLSDDLMDQRIRDLQGVALQVVENASQTAASTAGSEAGEPMDPRDRRRIDEWLNQNVSEGSYRTELGSRGSHEASTSHLQIPSIQLQTRTLHRSSLGLGGNQTQPTSSDSTSTGTTRRSQTRETAMEEREKKFFNNYLYIFLLALVSLLGAIVCCVLGSIYDWGSSIRHSEISTLVIAIITIIWCLIRLAQINGVIGRTIVSACLGLILEWLLGVGNMALGCVNYGLLMHGDLDLVPFASNIIVMVFGIISVFTSLVQLWLCVDRCIHRKSYSGP